MSWFKTTLLALGTALVLAFPGYTDDKKPDYSQSMHHPSFYSRGQNKDLTTDGQFIAEPFLKVLGKNHDGVGRLPENSAKLTLYGIDGNVRTFIDGYGGNFSNQYGKATKNYPFDGNPDFAKLLYPSFMLTSEGQEVENRYGAEFREYRDKLLADSLQMFIKQIRSGYFKIDKKLLTFQADDKTYAWVRTIVGCITDGKYVDRNVVLELNATDIDGDGKTDYFCVLEDGRYILEMFVIGSDGIQEDIGNLVPFAKMIDHEKIQGQPSTKKTKYDKYNLRKSKSRN